MPFDALEYVVRPYATPNAHGAIIIPSTPRDSRQRATLTWGKPTTMPPVENTGVNFDVLCCKDDLTELSRESDKKRIFQNGDESSENWVDVERPNMLKLNKKEKNTCGDNWDAISGVAQQVDSTLAEWQNLISSVTGTSDKNCGEQWHFKNQ
jgi:hypothetical protein